MDGSTESTKDSSTDRSESAVRSAGSAPTHVGTKDAATSARAKAIPAKRAAAKRTGAAAKGTGADAKGTRAAAKRTGAAAKRTDASDRADATRTAAAGTAGVTKRRTATGATGETAAPGAIGETAAPGAIGAPRWRGRPRNRDLYDRGVQRANEQWPLVTRAVSGLLRHPDSVLGLLGSKEPVEREGRVLNRGVQAMLGVIDRFERFDRTADGAPDAEAYDPEVMRRRLRRSARAVMPVRTDVYVSGRVIPGPEGAPPIGIRIYRQFGSGLGAGPEGRRRLPAIVFFHGGGWVIGDLDTHDALCRILAAASRCLVVAVDYRLAPEHPFPAAVDDSLAAYAWVHEHSDELGIAAGHIGVMGDSSGGNLAAVVAQLTRPGTGRATAPPPVAQGLVYPVLDARFGFESMRALADGFLLTRAEMEWFRSHYLPDPADWEAPSASPLLAEDLGGLAPALVVTAGFDPMRDDGTNYAEALQRADVAVEHRRYEDQIHGFMIMGIVPDSLALATEVCEAMGRLMRREAPVDSA